jgi:hypothetical protein
VAGEINHVFHSSLNVLDIVFTKWNGDDRKTDDER